MKQINKPHNCGILLPLTPQPGFRKEIAENRMHVRNMLHIGLCNYMHTKPTGGLDCTLASRRTLAADTR